MKNIFACFIFAMSFFPLNAQITSAVSVDIRYRIDQKDSAVPISPFFVSRLGEGFTTADRQFLLDLTANRILQKVNAGDSVRVYNPVFELYPGFSSFLAIEDCKNIKPADLSKPNGQIGGQGWISEMQASYFKLKSGSAVSQNITVFPDKKISYAADTVMITGKKEKLIPLLRYRYLLPDQVSVFFTERWNFDAARGHMDKKVNYYGYYIKKFTYAGDFVGYTPAFCIQNPEPTGALANNVLMKKNVICDVAVNWPEQTLRNDENLERYRGADAVNYLSIAEGNIPAGDRAKMLAAIFNFALNNPGNVCPANNGSIDSLHPYVSLDQIQSLFSKLDTVYYEDPLNPGTFIMNELKSRKTIDDVYAIRFYEDWYYDAKEFTIKKIVRGIGMMMMDRDGEGNPVIKDAGIYIRMN